MHYTVHLFCWIDCPFNWNVDVVINLSVKRYWWPRVNIWRKLRKVKLINRISRKYSCWSDIATINIGGLIFILSWCIYVIGIPTLILMYLIPQTMEKVMVDFKTCKTVLKCVDLGHQCMPFWSHFYWQVSSSPVSPLTFVVHPDLTFTSTDLLHSRVNNLEIETIIINITILLHVSILNAVNKNWEIE